MMDGWSSISVIGLLEKTCKYSLLLSTLLKLLIFVHDLLPSAQSFLSPTISTQLRFLNFQATIID